MLFGNIHLHFIQLSRAAPAPGQPSALAVAEKPLALKIPPTLLARAVGGYYRFRANGSDGALILTLFLPPIGGSGFV
jgi:hypothetical protein